VKELDIVIIEDEPRDAEAMEAALREERIVFRSRRIETRDQFTHILHESPPDVVLSDFSLPEFNAMEALRILQSIRPDIPFILVTGNRSEEVAVACIQEGADDYILKASLRRLPSSVMNALRKCEAEREKAAYEVKLRQLPRLILEAQENERRRVSRELHDGVNQLLSSVKFRIQSIHSRLPEKGEESVVAEVEATRELLERAIHEVSRISRNLRPSELDDLGLVPALRSLCNEVEHRTGVRVDFQHDGKTVELVDLVELNLYRIAQEALMNVEKHARAKRVEVGLEREGGMIKLRVADDGQGCEVGEKSHSLSGDIEERTRLVEGSFQFDSSPGRGTTLMVQCPVGVDWNGAVSAPPESKTMAAFGES
jgi:signal transduction histidine kinase